MSRPLVAIVGRPNVGKSLLFNRLVGKRLSIVEDTPGVTRDRLYAECEWSGRTFDIVDTGGIDEYKFAVVPLRLCIDAVACDTRGVLYYRATLAYKLIEKRAFANVGSADYGYYRF